MDDSFYYLAFTPVITLVLTVVFSFVPEKYLTPLPAKISDRSIVLHVLLVTILFLSVTLVVQRLIFASLAVSIFLIILSGVSNAKFQALREPLVFSDIAMFSQAFKHPRLYFPFLGLLPVIIMPILIVSLITLLLLIEPAMPFTWQRLLFTAIAIGLCFIAAKKIALQLNLSEEPAADNAQFGLLNSLFSYAVQANSDKHQKLIAKTLSHSPFALTKHAKKHSDNVKESTQKTSPHLFNTFSPQSLSNITVIQSESFFDARRLHDSINSDVLKHYDNCLNDSFQYGKLKVPAWGANTMRTEFTFLTGLKYEEMGLYRYYPYQYLHKMPIVSLAKLLQSQGYHCVCIHPHPASFFGRDRIFPKMGFDEFIDIDDFDDKTTFGPYISDQVVTDKILEVNKKHKGKPLFIFAITMENHGPLHLEQTTVAEQSTYFSEAPIDKISDLTVYLRHLKNADNMIHQLTSFYRKLDESVTLCFYGDHIPSMPKIYQELSYEDRDSDYFIWNNKIADTKTRKSILHDINVDNLAQTLLKQTENIES